MSMIPDPYFLVWAFHRVRKGRVSLRDAAVRTWELSPAETTKMLPAICLTGETDRILGYSPWTSRAEEEVSIRGGHTDHAPTLAFQLNDARVAGPIVYCRAYKAGHGYGPEQKFLRIGSQMHTLPQAHLGSAWAGSHFFGPFLRDLPLEMIPETDTPVIGLAGKPYVHEDCYRLLLDLPKPEKVLRGRIGTLTVYEDFAQNSFKVARYRVLRRRLRAALGEPTATPAGVYLRRGGGGEARIMINQDVIEAALLKIGFDILDPSTMDAAMLAKRCLDAPVVISIEGSHVSHAIYPIAEDGVFVVLQPPDRFSTVHKQFADALGMRFAFLVGTPAAGGFSVDPDALMRLLDQVWAVRS